MFKNLASRILATCFALALMLSFNASAANEINDPEIENTINSQKKCSKITNQELTKTIKEKFAADADIKEQMRHLNVSVRNRVVRLEGWLDEDFIPKAVKIARETRCVIRVRNDLRKSGGTGCAHNQKQCGDTCIDKDSPCTIDSPLIPND